MAAIWQGTLFLITVVLVVQEPPEERLVPNDVAEFAPLDGLVVVMPKEEH